MIKRYAPYLGRLLKLALPLVLTHTGQMVVQLVDSAMVGRVGTNELAAASFAGSVFVLIMVFGQGLTIGLTPLIGQFFGAQKRERVASLIKNGYIFFSLLAIVLFLLSWVISYALPYMGQKETVVLLASPYFRLLCLSLIPVLIFSLFKQVAEGLGNTVTAMVATVISNLLNVLLNWLLIFGHGPFPQMGLLGAGYATLLSRIVLPFIMVIVLKRLPTYKEMCEDIIRARPSYSEIKNIFKTGFPIALQILIEVMMFAFSGIMMGWISPVALAAHQVANTLTGLTFMVGNGISQAVTIQLSILRGRPEERELRRTAISGVILVLSFMLLCSGIFYYFRFSIPHLFTKDNPVIMQTAALLVVGALFQIIDGAQCMGLGILRGFSDVKVPMIIAFISYLLIGIPVGYLSAFVLGAGAQGIWFGYVAGLGTASVALYIRISSQWGRLTRSI